MKIGLFPGSFNPIHIGHLIIANLAYENTDLDEVWFIVSPQNPFKKNKNLLHEFDRLDMVQAAIHDDFHFKVSDIEFGMPKPSYTIDTLIRLVDKYPENEFSLIIGGDNLASLPNWKNGQIIINDFRLIVYPRPNSNPTELAQHPNMSLIDAPQLDISATLIRKLIRAGKSIKYLVPQPAIEMIDARKLFT